MKGAYKKEIGPVETTLRPITILKLHDTVDDLYSILIHGIAGGKNRGIPTCGIYLYTYGSLKFSIDRGV